ncbi:MAG TPA: S8 family serine peptidase [Thermoanaerobaculia bacterium]|jgi:hypothetical protein|nr:S8 family serine peptidase [Thermoanaerobaculia bacterium]
MGKKINVIVQLHPSAQIAAFALDAGAPGPSLPAVDGIAWDWDYGAQRIGAAPAGTFDVLAEDAAGDEMYIARGQVDSDDLPALFAAVEAAPETRAVFSDPLIQPFITCGNSPAVGNAANVAALLGDAALAQKGMTGKDVAVAIVDTGIDVAFLTPKVTHVNFDATRSFSFSPTVTPGAVTANHGTMCAFDVKIGAPDATLIDIAVLHPATLTNLLSDAIRAYRHMLDLIVRGNLFGTFKALVVTNSWGVFDPAADMPPPSNYIDNPAHPLNVIVGTLARAGADILFAAGNCGPQCQDIRCGTSVGGTIYGANSSADVCCVAGVDINKQRVGYSSMGPGRLTAAKPDLAGYTHFAGSGVHSIDSGTSAATPVVAGFFAAVRSRISQSSKTPADFRKLMIAGLDRAGTTGHDLGIGFGIVDGATFLAHQTGAGGGVLDIESAPPPAVDDDQAARDISQP